MRDLLTTTQLSRQNAQDLEPRFSRCLLSAVAGAVLLVAGLAFQPALAEESEGEADPVVATLDGEEIRFSQVLEASMDLPQQILQQFDQFFPLMINRYLDSRLLADKAEQTEFSAEAEARIEERMAEFRRQVISEALLEERIEEYVTDERVREEYDRYVAAFEPSEEARARHILVDSEEEARAIIERLEEGEDFAEIASAESNDPTAAQRGGDLGYFDAQTMVPAFSEAAFALQPGEITSDPVETQFGWHVIKLEDKRETQPESFEARESELRTQLQREVVEMLIAELRQNREIETFPERRPVAPGEALEELQSEESPTLPVE